MSSLHFVSFLFCSFSFFSAVNADCEGGCVHGYCASGDTTCTCDLFYNGKTCDISWKSDNAWYITFEVFAAYTVVLFVVLSIRSGYQLYLRLQSSSSRKRWSLITYVLLLIFLACMIRWIYYAIDPHTVRGIDNLISDEIIFDIPVILITAGLFLLQLYWIELQLQSGIVALYSIKKFKPVLLVAVVITVGVLIPVSIWRAVTAAYASDLIYSAFFIILAVANMLFSFIFGPRLHKFMRSYADSRNRAMNIYLTKTTNFMIGLDVLLLFSIIFLLLYTVIYARDNRWIYTGLHLVYRSLEGALCEVTIIFFETKRPRVVSPVSSKASNSASGRTTEKFTSTSKEEEEDPETSEKEEEEGEGEQEEYKDSTSEEHSDA